MTCTQPIIRGMQAARESAGIYHRVDAVGWTLQYTAEQADVKPTITPKDVIMYEGSAYTNTVNPS